MKITPLPSVGEVGKQAHLNGLEKAQSSRDIDDVRTVLSYGYFSSLVGAEITQDRNQAYTSLIEGIEGMITEEPLYVGETQYRYNKGDVRFVSNMALLEIIEQVVKPLYGKKTGDNASTK